MQGLNSTVQIKRQTGTTDDVAGGAQYSGFADVEPQRAIRAMISQKAASMEMRAQGLGTDRLYDATIQPAMVAVINDDILIPLDGPFKDVRFRVTAVIRPVMHLQSPRAHLKLQLERWDDGSALDTLSI